jgi:hypothetical protein
LEPREVLSHNPRSLGKDLRIVQVTDIHGNVTTVFAWQQSGKLRKCKYGVRSVKIATYSQNFIFIVTYERAQSARALVPGKPFGPRVIKH